MHLSKINLFLAVLLVVATLALFLQSVKLTNTLSFNERRIDELEKRPLVATEGFVTPLAGESGKVDLKTTVPTRTPSPTPLSSATPTPSASPSSAKKVSYLPIYGGNTQTTNTTWIDVVGSDFQFTVAEFGTGSYITWDAIAWVIGGSGVAKMHLLDTTNGVVVPGSEISVTAAKPTLVTSGKLIFLNGSNTYRVQISSQTSSTIQFDFGRLKIVY